MTALQPLSPPPGPWAPPLIGHSLRFLRAGGAFFADQRARYGPVFTVHLFGAPTVVVSGAEATRFVLTQEGRLFGPRWPPSTARLLGRKAITTQSGAVHAQRRRLFAQVLGRRELAGSLPRVEEIAREHLAVWAAHPEVTLVPLLNRYAMAVACAVVLGEGAAVEAYRSTFSTWGEGLFSLPINLPFTAFGRALQAREALLALIRARLDQGDRGSDMASVLLRAVGEEGQPLDREELADQLLTLLFAGHDTSSSTLSSFFLLIAQHPAVRARLVAEQAAFDPAQPLRLEDLEAMPLLRQTLNEVMRIYPPVAGVFRKVEQDCSFGGWRFPAGWAVLVALGLNHNDPAVFPEPTRFDPDRFAPEAVAGRDRFAFLPFGAGPRVCAGLDYAWLETGVLAALALRTLDWRLLPGQDLSMTLIPLPRPRDGLRLALERR